MPVTKPVTRNYIGPLQAQVAIFTQPPPGEAPQFIPIDITWGNYPNLAAEINLQNNGTLAFSRIVAIAVDNSDCGADVRFIFTDTDTTVTIPAYTPYCIVPVFTNSRIVVVQTGVNGQVVPATDTTRFQIHNALPPPISVPVSLEQNTSTPWIIPGDVVGSTSLIAAGINGTLEVITVDGFTAAGIATANWRIKDGLGNILLGGRNTSQAAAANLPPFSPSQLQVRFQNGLIFEITASGLSAGSLYAVNAFYRRP